MKPDELRSTVLSTLKTIAPELDAAGVDPARSLRGQVDLDSMDWLNFLIALHARLGVEIPETDYGKLQTLDGILAYFAQKLG
jgi:acyl carrier protein